MQKKYRRLQLILLTMLCLIVATTLVLYALRDNISYFYSPTKIMLLQQNKSPVVAPGRVIRLGGMVEDGSILGRGNDMSLLFTVTDFKEDVRVSYAGILPTLFREGQGVIAKGTFDKGGVFVADTLLSKHDENYMPPEVAKALEESQK